MKTKHFYEPIFRIDVQFITDSTTEEIDVWITKNRKGTHLDGVTYTDGAIYTLEKTEKNGNTFKEYLVFVKEKDDIYVLIHETHHLASLIMRDCLIPISKENDEVAAYLQEYWLRTLWRFMNNKVVSLKRKK